MIPVSDKFLKALKWGHTETSRAELWADNSYVQDLLVDGSGSSLTVDASAEVMRYCSLTLAEPLVPGLTPDDLWPIGPEVRLYSGLIYPDGSEEWVGQGIFRLSKPQSEENGIDPVVTKLDGYDYSKVINRNRFTEPWIISQGTNPVQAIIAIAQDRLPPGFPLIIKATSTSITLLQTILAHGGESKPFSDMQDLADSCGKEVFFDHEGALVIRDYPDPNTTLPVYDYIDDDESMYTKMQRIIDEERAYSGVVLLGVHPDTTPVNVEVWDTDPSSPTYVNRYGRVPYFIDTQFIAAADLGQPELYARTKLAQVKGIIENVTFDAIANVAHEQNDIVNIRNTALNVNSTVQLSAFTRSLEPGASLQFTTRKSRIGTLDE